MIYRFVPALIWPLCVVGCWSDKSAPNVLSMDSAGIVEGRTAIMAPIDALGDEGDVIELDAETARSIYNALRGSSEHPFRDTDIPWAAAARLSFQTGDQKTVVLTDYSLNYWAPESADHQIFPVPPPARTALIDLGK